MRSARIPGAQAIAWTGRPKCLPRANCCPPRSAWPTCEARACRSAGCDARDWLHAQCAAQPERVVAATVGVLPLRGRCRLARALRRRCRALLVTQGFIARSERRRHRDPRARRLGYFGRLFRRVAAARDASKSGPTCRACSAPIRATVPDARLLTRLDYDEAQEIATTGAKVLHPRCDPPVPRRARADLDPRHRAPAHARHA